MTVVLTVKERLVKIETQLLNFQNEINGIQSKLSSIDEKLDRLELHQRGKLCGKDKAVVYGSLLTAIGLIVSELIRMLI